MAPWILLALLGLGAYTPAPTVNVEVHAVWLSYPWRLPKAQKETLASYLATKSVNRVYLSVYDEGRMRWTGTALAKAGYAAAGEEPPLLGSVGLFRARGSSPWPSSRGGSRSRRTPRRCASGRASSSAAATASRAASTADG